MDKKASVMEILLSLTAVGFILMVFMIFMPVIGAAVNGAVHPVASLSGSSNGHLESAKVNNGPTQGGFDSGGRF